MKKDMPLLMERTVYTYIFLLVMCFILKITGLDYFGINTSSPFIMFIDKIANNIIFYNLINFILIMFYQYVITSLILNDTSIKLTLYSLIPTFLFQFFLKNILIYYNINILGELLYLFILCLIYNKINKTTDRLLKRFIVVILLNLLFQFISCSTRYKYLTHCIDSHTIDFILNIDYIIMILMSYKIYFTKGDVNLCGVFRVVVGSFLQKLISLPKLLRKYLTEFSNKTKKIKFEITLYTILLLLWNVFTVCCVLFVAFLNDTLIECIFILSSFWLNKTVFGKPFHFKNTMCCFIISNLTYYCLNRITTPLDISIVVPIMLGILLSYITSRLVKKNQKKLYKGMSEEELKYWLDKVTDNTLDYKICKLYYVERYSEVKVASMTCYSVENIKKRKRVINDLLKELII